MSQVLTSKYPLFNYQLSAFAPWGVVDLTSDAELMEFMMRVRRWEIEIDVTEATDGAFAANGVYLVASRSQYYNGVETDVPASERDLVVGTAGSHAGELILDAPFNVYTFTWQLVQNFAVGVTAGVEDAWQIETSLELGTQPLGKGLDTKDNSGGGGNPVSAVVCSIYGYPVTLYDIFGGTWTGSITAIPIEWWESRPTSGGDPIFDSTNGSQIGPNVLID